MLRVAPFVLLLMACGSGAPADERVATATQRFVSADATLVDFEMDGGLVADASDPAVVRTLIDAQLLFAVGQLNGERSVGWYERLEVSAISATPSASTEGRYQVRYHAKLPVAWGGPSVPASYTLVLPAAVGAADQVRFTDKYGTTCVDPDGGDLNAGGRADAGRMFLFYRPQRSGCTLAPADVVSTVAKVTPSSANSTAKYPEYHRIWEDGALDYVAVFGIELEDAPSDAGVKAFDDFSSTVASYLAALQPDETKRTTTRTVIDGRRRLRVEATLPDGRAVHVDALLVGPDLANESASFDAWYDAAARDADVILYSGHAAHGANVHTLMTKGSFQTGKYVVFVVNGCNTLAYVDRTLADRRASLNADDPSGTKYMDTVSNVLGAWFRMGDETGMRFLRDMVSATGANAQPKTYRQIFADVDRAQVIVVTGEEDNEFPLTPQPVVVRSPPADAPPPNEANESEPNAGDGEHPRATSGCSVAPLAGEQHAPSTPRLLFALGVVLAIARSAARSRSNKAKV